MKTESQISEDRDRRNQRLKAFLDFISPDFKLLGDENKPAIVYKNELCIAAYVHNFDLRLCDISDGETVVRTIKLTESFTNSDVAYFKNHVETGIHKKVFKIGFPAVGLFLAGWNFEDKEKPETRYPVFAPTGFKIYFKEDYAEKTVNDYSQKYNINLQVI